MLVYNWMRELARLHQVRQNSPTTTMYHTRPEENNRASNHLGRQRVRGSDVVVRLRVASDWAMLEHVLTISERVAAYIEISQQA